MIVFIGAVIILTILAWCTADVIADIIVKIIKVLT